ncbi:Zn-ribbon domain-containing OB-fold protein [Conexibacter sp. CPCC 206217]|uniref:Zn-ribbon domain-containing OB-fold protein n=1 Tax=Conexibacter sp. CPCC 206217 TaxID=3064574 RepID=UPI002723C13E|nr:Zn-ribbon domain-containing OB-fold protein [Conexibacter sp. CPCC 206217]MDO8210118.1 Zn-ribbon domain-containing OB-fold protein [Conexibacter sp. CPCC 206217]
MPFPRSNLAEISTPFFDACERGELIVPRCDACGRLFFYPTVLCPHCHSEEWGWQQVSGEATIYSFTEVHRPLGSQMPAPYVVAVVELAEGGVRMMTNILGVEPGGLAIGDPVRVQFGTSWDGRTVPLFVRAGHGDGDGGA